MDVRIEELLEKWRERQSGNLEWRDRYFALHEQFDAVEKELKELKSQRTSFSSRENEMQDDEMDKLKDENEALRVKCEVLLEALEMEKSRVKASPLRQTQSMRGIHTGLPLL